MIRGINHITFEVSDVTRSVAFYREVLGARLTARGAAQAYFDFAGVWLALNAGATEAPAHHSYNHVAFTVDPPDLDLIRAQLAASDWPEESDRTRNPAEASSLYVRDPDGHLLEFHTGTHEQRLQYLATAGLGIRVVE